MKKLLLLLLLLPTLAFSAAVTTDPLATGIPTGGALPGPSDSYAFDVISGTRVVTTFLNASTLTASIMETFDLVVTGSSTFTGIENHSAVLDNATGDQVGFTYNIIADKASSGDATGLEIDCTDTSSPGLYRCLDIKYDNISLVNSNADGEVNFNTTVNSGIRMNDGVVGIIGFYHSGVIRADIHGQLSGSLDLTTAGGRAVNIKTSTHNGNATKNLFISGTFNTNAGINIGVYSDVTLTQSGTAGATGFKSEITKTTVGSGPIRHFVGTTDGDEVFIVDSFGNISGTSVKLNTNDADTVAIATFGNLSTSCKLFIVQSDPEGRVTGNECDRAWGLNGGGNGNTWLKRTGDGTAFGWEAQSLPTSLSSLWVNGASVQTAIANQSEFVEITHFVNLGEEDENGNAVGSTANDNITIGANGAGDYTIVAQASTKMNSGTNLEILVIPKIALATPKTITDATNATPIVITTSAAHLLKTGDYVTQSGVVGNTAANGDFYIIFLTATTYSLQAIDTTYSDAVGNGAYVSDGTVDAEYPGNVAQPVSRSSSLFGRGAASGTHDLFAGDVVSLCVLNRSNANEVNFTQIAFGIERKEIE